MRSWEDGPTLFLPNEQKAADPETFSAHRTSHPLPFFFSPGDRAAYAPLLANWDDESRNPMLEADALSRGQFRFFEHHELQCAFPPKWHTNAFTKATSPAEKHWSEIADFGYGDIKAIWEPSRFGFVYALVRAYWRTGNEEYPGTFWRLVESWRESNPPQRGANWKCGQEATFRAMAWSFGLHGFWDSSATTPQRVFQLAQMLGITAERIAANIDYAIGQANNHGISEGVGLWTIGTLFPEFAAAEAWRERGRVVLEAEGRKLIYDDGSFSQHSVNYHRLMLHDYLWTLRLGELQQQPFSDELKQRVARAGEFLFQLQDETTGAVPYYGQNDGALILPLNNCSYHDFRPVVNATHFLTNRSASLDNGPWSEDLLWLFGPNSLVAPVVTKPRTDLRADVGGYYTLRSDNSFVFTRCGSFSHRPGQADMLHVDLWWRGQNIALDAGTYSYNPSEAWADEFAGSSVHNTVTVDDRAQMERVGRFLWLPWLHGRCQSYLRQGSLAYFEGEHDGYLRLQSPVMHRRGIAQLDDDTWLVLDCLTSDGKHRHRLHWLLPDVQHQFDTSSQYLMLKTPAGEYHLQVGTFEGQTSCSLIRADPQTARGWRAPYYHFREPALSLTAEQTASAASFWTLFSPERCNVEVQNEEIQIRAANRSFGISLGSNPQQPLVTRITSGAAELIIH